MIKKNAFPILEFDDDKTAKISAELMLKKYPAVPERLIITFFKDAIIKLLEENRIKLFTTIRGENNLDVYKFVDEEVIIIHGFIGGPGCGGFYEDLIGLGVRKTMFCGGGGALRKDLIVGKLIVVDSAIRDEGLSYHYLPPSREVSADFKTVNLIKNYLDKNNYQYIVGKVWTTDAFYRETESRIKQRTEEGALLVEMEQAGMLAVSQFRNLQYGALVYAGDDLTGATWDNRDWKSRTELRYQLIQICLEIVKTF